MKTVSSENWFTTMLSSTRKPVSAKQNLSLLRSCGYAILCSLLGFLLFFATPATCADSLEDSARALARKVVAAIRATSVTCQIRNLSTLRGPEFATVSAAFQDELQKHGLKIMASDAATSLIVTVTQNPTAYIGVVEIQRKENPETVMETLGPVRGPSAPELTYSYSLHRELLFSQDEPVLDVVLDDDGKHAAALGTDEVVYYESRDDQWVPTRSERLPLQRDPERELRGFLVLAADLSKTAYLPGELCRAASLAATGWSCEKHSRQIPAQTITPDVTLGKKTGEWTSTAKLEREGKRRIVVIGQDGLARVYEDGPEPVAVFRNFGSEIASLYSGCGTGWQLLVTGKGDWTKADEIQAMEIRERQTQAVSAAMEFPGPVIALHTPATKPLDDASANASAIAIDRNLQTGRYEAYRLTITCSN
jgi:hypothetical protein